jgi:hypothetical protein
VFSIDGHELEVIEADFVPIEPYTARNVLVGIGIALPYTTREMG